MPQKPCPPYYAVIFRSQRTEIDAGYAATAQRMEDLAADRPGFLGIDSVRDANGLGITISYWSSLEAIAAWNAHAEHQEAQARGRAEWYRSFDLKICRVEAERSWEAT